MCIRDRLLNVIRHTPYYNIIKNIETDKNGIIPYTKCEVMLRTYYMKWLIETAKKDFSGTSQTALLDQFNIQTDVINLSLIHIFPSPVLEKM